MHDFDWQNAVALALVATAALYLAFRAVAQLRKRKSGCATGCASCPVQEPSNTAGDAPIVSREELSASGRRLRNSK